MTQPRYQSETIFTTQSKCKHFAGATAANSDTSPTTASVACYGCKVKSPVKTVKYTRTYWNTCTQTHAHIVFHETSSPNRPGILNRHISHVPSHSNVCAISFSAKSLSCRNVCRLLCVLFVLNPAHFCSVRSAVANNWYVHQEPGPTYTDWLAKFTNCAMVSNMHTALLFERRHTVCTYSGGNVKYVCVARRAAIWHCSLFAICTHTARSRTKRVPGIELLAHGLGKISYSNEN